MGRLDATETQSAGQTISRNARHLAHLVDDLLDLSAVTSGKIRVDPEETDICEIVEAARAHYRRVLEREPWLIDQMIEGGRGREVAEAGGG